MDANREIVPLNQLNGQVTRPSIRVKLFTVWKRTYWNNPNVVASIEMVLMDQEGNKILGVIPKKLISFYGNVFKEGSYFDLAGFGVYRYEEEKYRMADHMWKVVFFRTSSVKRTPAFDLPQDGFFPVDFDAVNEWTLNPVNAFDVLGQLVQMLPIDIKWDKGSAKKTINFYLRDLTGNRIRCALWSTLAEELYDYVKDHKQDGSPLICLISNCKLRDFGGPQVSNQLYGCRLMIDTNINTISTFKTAIGANIESGLLPAVNPDDLLLATNETFKHQKFNALTKYVMAEVHTIEEVKSFVILGEVASLCLADGWFGWHCQNCKKKVHSQYCLDNEEPVYFCTNCDREVTEINPKIRLNLNVADSTGNINITLFDTTLAAMLNKSVAWLNVAAVKAGDPAKVIDELWELLCKKFVWIVNVSSYMVINNNYSHYTVEDVSDDPLIMNETEVVMKEKIAAMGIIHEPVDVATPADKGKSTHNLLGGDGTETTDDKTPLSGSVKRKSECSLDFQDGDTPTTSTTGGIASLKIPRMDDL